MMPIGPWVNGSNMVCVSRFTAKNFWASSEQTAQSLEGSTSRSSGHWKKIQVVKDRSHKLNHMTHYILIKNSTVQDHVVC